MRLLRPFGRDLEATLDEDVIACALRAPAAPGAPVTDADLAGLPDPVRRYLRFMGVVGRPRDWSFRAHTKGRFRLRPGQRFMRCEIWQYDSAVEVARLFHMRIDFAGILPLVGRDSYVRGRGRMRGRLLGLVTVADGEGDELDIGELVTYLNDCILFAPSMLLTPTVEWSGVDDTSFDVSLTDSGRTVRGRVFLDARGAPRDFSTTDRFAEASGKLVRTEWRTPVTGWTTVDGRTVAQSLTAVWHLPDGEFTYADVAFDPRALEYNVAPTRYRRSGAS